MNIFQLEWAIFFGMGLCIGVLFLYSPKPNLNAKRLAYKVDHVLDIIQELKELSMNIAVKDATDYFDGGVIDGCGKETLLPNEMAVVGVILDTKSKQAYDILHQVLIDLKAA